MRLCKAGTFNVGILIVFSASFYCSPCPLKAPAALCSLTHITLPCILQLAQKLYSYHTRQPQVPLSSPFSFLKQTLTLAYLRPSHLPPAPRKDCEIVILGSHFGCAAFKRMLHVALRALIDGLGCSTFNAAALNINIALPTGDCSSGASRDGGGGSTADCSAGDGSSGMGDSRMVHVLPVDELWVPGGFDVRRPPVVARLVSRGKLDNIASDFGGLEVFGGASIGHTDPYRVLAAIDEQLAVLK